MSDNRNTVCIRFSGLTLAEQGRAAQELLQDLERGLSEQGLSDAALLSIERESRESQDFGATLILVLGTPAVLAIAKGVHDWIAKRGSQVRIETPEGKVIATGDGVENIDVARTVEALRGEI